MSDSPLHPAPTSGLSAPDCRLVGVWQGLLSTGLDLGHHSPVSGAQRGRQGSSGARTLALLDLGPKETREQFKCFHSCTNVTLQSTAQEHRFYPSCGQAATVPGRALGTTSEGRSGHQGMACKPVSRSLHRQKPILSGLPPLKGGHYSGKCLSHVWLLCFEDFLLKGFSVPCSGQAQLGGNFCYLCLLNRSRWGPGGCHLSRSSSAMGGRVGTAWPPGTPVSMTAMHSWSPSTQRSATTGHIVTPTLRDRTLCAGTPSRLQGAASPTGVTLTILCGAP